MKVVEDIEGGESRGSAVAKMRAMIDSKLGPGSAAEATTFGQLRSLLNDGAPLDAQIQNGELGSGVRAKLNGWHNAAPLALQQPPQITPDSAEVGATFTVTPGVYGGAVPIQITGELTQAGVVVASRSNGDPFTFLSTAPGALQWAETAQNIKGQAPAIVATATVHVLISDFYGIGPGEVPMRHNFSQSVVNASGQLVSSPNAGGAGSLFNLTPGATAIPVVGGRLDMSPAMNLRFSNTAPATRPNMMGTRIFIVADLRGLAVDQFLLGNGSPHANTFMRADGGRIDIERRRPEDSVWERRSAVIRPPLEGARRIYELDFGQSEIQLFVNGGLRSTVQHTFPEYRILDFAAGHNIGNGNGLDAWVSDIVSIIHGGQSEARIPLIRQRLADTHGVTL